MLGFPILYCKGMRPMMFQLSGFYCRFISTLTGVRSNYRTVVTLLMTPITDSHDPLGSGGLQKPGSF